MITLSDKFKKAFINIHNRFVETDVAISDKADKAEIPTKVSELENDTNYVTNTDYATAEVGGVVKVATSGNSYGIIKNSNNIIQISYAEKSDIAAKGSYTKPITPVNLDYAVEICTNQTMSDDNTEAQGQLPASYDAVKTYVDDGLTSKADKSDLDSINNILNKNFELIATQTVSPDTDGSLPNAIEFTVDNELTDFYLYVNAKITATSAVRLYTNDVSLWGNATIPGLYNANTTLYYHWYIQYLSFGENKGGIISAPSQAIANSSGVVRQPQGNLYNDYSVIVPHTSVLDKVSAINNIKKIKLSLVSTANNQAFAEGSTFELWGVKKK